jgi:hypothetical protein
MNETSMVKALNIPGRDQSEFHESQLKIKVLDE